MKHIKSLFILSNLLLITFLFGCDENTTQPEPVKGHISFGVNFNNPSHSKITEDSNPSAVLITVVNENSEVLYNFEKLSLIEINGSYVSSSIELDTGSYTIEDFIVIDDNETSIYIAPKSGSDLEYLVSNPLPFEFQVSSDSTTSVQLDVVSALLGQASDFGYAEFVFNVTVDLAEGLIAYYPFNGNANDESPNSNDGTVYGATLSEDRNRHHESAYYFDGIDDYINLGTATEIDFSQYDKFSISLWVNPDEINIEVGETILGRYDSYLDNRSFQMSHIPSDQIGFTTFKDGNTEEYNRIATDITNEWTHLTLNKTDSTLDLYINGILVGTEETSFPIFSSSADLEIGATHRTNITDENLNFQGLIDDIRIYSRILTPYEINYLSNN